jgi:hypothetical protein
MLYKILLILGLSFAINTYAAVQSLEVLVKKTDLIAAAEKKEVIDLFMLNGIRQAVTKELINNKLDNDEFWKKFEEKKFSENEEVGFFSPVFTSKQFIIKPPVEEAPIGDKTAAVDLYTRGDFNYDLDSEKFKKLYDEVINVISIPDVTIKTFYILPEIAIDSKMTWEDVGVSKKENFSGVIIDSWTKWAIANFKNFTNVVILEKDFVKKNDNINPESVILKWNSMLDKSEVFQDRKSARFEMSAQYILVNAKSGDSLVAFDFPNQKREYNIDNSKQLSSNLASLVFNLLNSQTKKIVSALEINKASSALTTIEMKVTGKAGLLDMSQINSVLAEHFKTVGLTSETKSYSSDSSLITVKSSAPELTLYELFSKDGGKFPLNEQKILVFNPTDHTFAIISKEANN